MTDTRSEADWAELDLPRARAAMPFVGEWITPWIAAAFFVAALSLAYVVGGRQLPILEQTLLAISLCATLAAATLVAMRSSRAEEASVREERARPSAEALVGGVRLGTIAYAHAMERWTGAVLELLEHAQTCVEEGSDEAGELDAAATEARELRELLETSITGELDINTAASIHALCSLWETNQPRVEELAAATDPTWHRRWSARVVADRRLRHGGTVSAPLEIPYRS